MKNPLPLLLVTAALGSPALAADKLAATQPPPGKAGGAATTATPVKKLRDLGIHAGLTKTGGTRSQDATLPVLIALAPAETARTVSASPVLYWFSSGAERVKCVLTLTPTKADQPLLETIVTGTQSGGVFSVNLATAGIKLEADRDYQWSISTAVNGEASSKDIVSQGRIRRVAAPPALAARLAGAPAETQPAIYAQEGFFYDAAASLLPLVEAQPDNGKLRAELDQLFTTFKISLARK
ncbi:hypothetical protein LBMAG56_35990 [Verrucomicrobiota bacterium]|nr:hypothetical protein LBMAG56_35990 [Verrucomicrobiota bacterium]